jgi:RecA/RadA recombinase
MAASKSKAVVEKSFAKVIDVSGATAKKEIAATKSSPPSFNPYAHLEAEIDGMEKKFGLTSMSISEKEDRFDSGLLCLNLQMAGGLLAGGWYTFFGGEQSCKTTNATNVLGSIIRQEDFLGRGAFFDYEGSFDATYAENMWRYAGNGRAKTVDDVFGVKDQNGNWIVQPRIRYYAPSVGEDFFNYVAKLEKVLPDVVLLDGSFYYIYENTKANQKAVSGLYDKAYFKKFNKFKVPAPNGLPQAIVLADSYPAMLPGRMDEKDEGTDGIASQARMFSDGVKRVKGAMKRKRIVVLGINQLRSVPMAMYGPTEQEPCGQALKFFSDCRFRMSSISIPHGKGATEEEDSLSGEGVDTYRYIKCKAHKNKLGGPQGSTMIMRIRVSDANGEASGFCRVWDCWTYLKETGQIGGQRNKIKFGEGTPFEGKVVSWMEFKALIDGDKEQIKKLCAKLAPSKKPLRLYEWCRAQIASGKGYKLYLQTIKNNNTKKAAKAAEAADSDSDDME